MTTEYKTTNEIRLLFSGEEFRAESEGGQPVIRGYVAKYNSDTELFPGLIERIDPDAFKESLARGDDVVATYDHQTSHILGRNTAGTLELSSDSKGLAVKIIPPDTQASEDLMKSIARGDVRGGSFGMKNVVQEEPLEHIKRGKYRGWFRRTIIGADVFEVTVTAFPAYKDTDIKVARRSYDLAVSDEELRAIDPNIRSGILYLKHREAQLNAAMAGLR